MPTDSMVLKIEHLLDWIVENGHEPTRGSTDQQEKTLAAFLANLRTSRKSLLEQGLNGKPLHWDEVFYNKILARYTNIRPDIFISTNTYIIKNLKKFQKCLDEISANGETTKWHPWLSSLRSARIDESPPWVPAMEQVLLAHNIRASTEGFRPVRANLFDVVYAEAHGCDRLKGILDRMKLRVGTGARVRPRNHIYRQMKKLGKPMTRAQEATLLEEERDANVINSLRQSLKQQKGMTFYPIYQTMVEGAGYPDLFNATGKHN